MDEILNMQKISKSYYMAGEELEVLHEIDLSVRSGEFLAIHGPSGSGKTTMMNIIGCLDVPTSGRYLLSGNDIADQDERELAQIRNQEIGFVFQSFQLLPRMTALQNVELPLIYAGLPASERRERATAILGRVGLGDKLKNLPSQLSGGQQQRVAIARAVVTDPGALDQRTGEQVMELFQELNGDGRTIIMITHDTNIARHAKRVVHILDGYLTEEKQV